MKVDDREAIKQALAEPRRVAELLGLRRAKDSRKHWICPRHGGGSLHLWRGEDGSLACHCFGCGELRGDVFTLLAAVHGLDVQRQFAEVARIARELAGLPQPEPSVWMPGPQRRRHAKSFPRVVVAPGPQPVKVYNRPPEHERISLWQHASGLALYEPGHPRYPAEQAELLQKLRGLPLTALAKQGMIGVLGPDSPVYPWTTFGGRSWYEAGYRLIVPCHDERGQLATLRAWCPNPSPGMPGRVPAKGYDAGGCILADAAGAYMLHGEHQRALTRPAVLIAEGEPDACTWAARRQPSLDGRLPYAVMGVYSGAWNERIAARIPDETHVLIATHNDAAGDGYFRQIAATLQARCKVDRFNWESGAIVA